MARVLPAAAATLAVTLGALGLAASPSAATAGRCPEGTGVTVVVDYGPLGGGVVTACDPDGAGRPATEVMSRTGFDLTFVSNQPGFVCRIEGKPDESQESCAQTPPPDAYWGLFWSDADPATWRYSSEGAGSLDVPEGGSIGWRFQDGGDRDDPGAPPNAAAQTPSPEPSPHPTKSPAPGQEGPSGHAAPTPTPSSTSTPSASVPPGTHGSGGTPDEGAKPGRRGDEPRPEPEKTDARDKDKEHKGEDGHGHDREKAHPDQAGLPSPSPTVAAIDPASGEPTQAEGSSAVLTLVAAGAVLALAGAAGVIAWRRRASPSP